MAETCRMMENSIRISKFNLFHFIADVKRRDTTRFGVMARHNLQGPAFHKIDPTWRICLFSASVSQKVSTQRLLI